MVYILSMFKLFLSKCFDIFCSRHSMLNKLNLEILHKYLVFPNCLNATLDVNSWGFFE